MIGAVLDIAKRVWAVILTLLVLLGGIALLVATPFIIIGAVLLGVGYTIYACIRYNQAQKEVRNDYLTKIQSRTSKVQ